MLVFGWLLAGAQGGPFSSLIVFGDSLSDVGNLNNATFGLFPGPSYYNGRVSNGPVFVESLSIGLGLGPITPSLADGNNFAFGGARTTGTTGIEGLFIQDIDEQVTSFLDSRTADPGALFLVFAGANDLVAGQTNLTIPIRHLSADIGRLYDAGARQFLAPNLPRLGLTPRYNGDPAQSATMNARTESFNDLLATMLDELDANNPEIEIFRFDIESRFDAIVADPAAYGFVNVTDAAAPGLEPGKADYDKNQIAPLPNSYLFWDELHPTAAGHALLAQAALRVLLVPEPDWFVLLAAGITVSVVRCRQRAFR